MDVRFCVYTIFTCMYSNNQRNKINTDNGEPKMENAKNTRAQNIEIAFQFDVFFLHIQYSVYLLEIVFSFLLGSKS